MENKKCILYDNKMCDNCGECNMCDLDPKKVCDSCGVCLDMDDDYNTMDIDLVMEENLDDPEMLSFEEMFPDDAFGGDRNWDNEDDDFDDVDYDDYDDFDNRDGFYDEDEFDDYEDEEDEDDLRRDFGDFFGRSSY